MYTLIYHSSFPFIFHYPYIIPIYTLIYCIVVTVLHWTLKLEIRADVVDVAHMHQHCLSKQRILTRGKIPSSTRLADFVVVVVVYAAEAHAYCMVSCSPRNESLSLMQLRLLLRGSLGQIWLLSFPTRIHILVFFRRRPRNLAATAWRCFVGELKKPLPNVLHLVPSA